MKTYYIFIFFILSGCGCLNKEPSNSSEQKTNNAHETNQDYKALSTFNGDTLRYVKENFLDKKGFYINKDLNVLLGNLELPIKAFIPGYDGNKLDIMPDITLEFYSYKEREVRIKNERNPILINIYFNISLPLDSVVKLVRKNHGTWTDVEKNYFGKQIVKDITIVNYNFK